MKYLIFLLFCMVVFCGGEEKKKEKDYVDVPAIITYMDAGIDSGVDSGLTMDFYMRNYCDDLRIKIAQEVEKCEPSIAEFSKYMFYIDNLDCNNIRSGNYKKFCEEQDNVGIV